jgi:hypothetical protein
LYQPIELVLLGMRREVGITQLQRDFARAIFVFP